MRILTCLLVALAPTGLTAAPPDPAELFPADTPLFVEVRRPGDLAQELAALVKGTILEDSLSAVNKVREKNKEQPYVDTYQLGLLGTLFGPEMLAEAKRFGGLALGVTGFTKGHEPERAAVLLTGDSQLPGMMVRMYLSTHGELHKVATVEGVDVYQENLNPYGVENGPIFFPGGGAFIQPGVNPNGNVYAYSPGRVFFGSSKEAVTTLVKRWKGKEKGGSLAAAPAFAEARELRESSAVFVFADPKALVKEANGRSKGRGRDIDSMGWAVFKGLINADAVRSAALGFTPDKGTYVAELQVRLEGSKPSPLLDLLSGAKLTATVPTLAVKDAGLALSVALPADGKSGERLLRLADAAAKASGTLGITPAEAVQELEEKAKLKVTADILAKLRGISVLLPPVRDWPKDGIPWPTLVLHTADADTVAAVETTLPALLKMLGLESVEPTTELVGEQKVRSIAGNGPPGPSAIHFASRGNSFAIGADRALVAESLEGKKLPPEVEAATKDACAVVVCPWGPMLPPLFGVSPKPPEPAKERPRKAPAKEEAPPASPVDPRAAAHHAFDDLVRSFDSAPPLVMSIHRDNDLVRATLRQSDPREAVRKSVDKWVEWMNRSAEAGMYNPYFQGLGGFGFPFLR